ncbi:MAG TPA: GNAT family N-acetyltransferase, partial [Bryobacteraceae bacterium]|nr:GNAT family N-acetyltransferase [Bryobacteraceae bacterium]
SHNNPVDIIGDADATRYVKTVEALARNPEGDGLLAIMAPQGVGSPTEIAEALRPYAKLGNGRPILASWMGGVETAEGERILTRAGIPNFPFPDAAARAFHYMWRYSYNLRGLYETPAAAEEAGVGVDRERVAAIIAAAHEDGRSILSETETKELLASYGIEVTAMRIAGDEDTAVRAAEEIGWPVALKLHSHTVAHKAEAGGVKLGVADGASVRAAFRSIREAAGDDFHGVSVQEMIRADGYELILGSSVDAQFGPVLLFGAGGRLVEILDDRALALPPLNTTLARRMMEQTRIYRALTESVDMRALERLLVRFSQLVVEQPLIREIEMNPLLAGGDRLIALDARAVLQPPGTDPLSIPRPAIRPYPVQYVSGATLRDGSSITVRPIRPEDEPMMVAFHHTLSERSVYMRYFHWMKVDQRTAHERLTRMCFIDYDRQIALVAEHTEGMRSEILGVGRLVRSQEPGCAEVAVVISDDAHGRGLGTLLSQRLIEVARQEGIRRLNASVLYENHAMLKILRKLGFDLGSGTDAETVEARLLLV